MEEKERRRWPLPVFIAPRSLSIGNVCHCLGLACSLTFDPLNFGFDGDLILGFHDDALRAIGKAQQHCKAYEMFHIVVGARISVV